MAWPTTEAASDGPPGARDNVAHSISRTSSEATAQTRWRAADAANSLDRRPRRRPVPPAVGGTDTVNYAGRTDRALNGDHRHVADDGSIARWPRGARDNVGLDVENLVGGRRGHADRQPRPQPPDRVPGADILRGLDGNDVLVANDGQADAELDCDGGTGDR